MSSRTVTQMTETQVEPNRWIPVTDRVVPKDSKGIMAKPGIKSRSTQTQGLFYPSAKSLSTKVLSEVHKQQNKSASLDRTKHLTEFSPGKGVCTCSIAVVSQTVLGVNYCEVEDCQAHLKNQIFMYISLCCLHAGLWRMQIDHVCSHLKAHSQCSPDFQEEIGQKEIGKVGPLCFTALQLVHTCSHHLADLCSSERGRFGGGERRRSYFTT